MNGKRIYIIAGPTGSGKTTFAKELIKDFKMPFINADEIAFDLAQDDFRTVRVAAGKIFFSQIDKCISRGRSFIVETTLAGRYRQNLFKELKSNQYE